jgi:hypothetical protein
MSDYLTWPLAKRLARYLKERDSQRFCGYPHPDGSGRYCLTPILHPDRNARWKSGGSTMLWVEDHFGRTHRWCDEVCRYIRHTGWFTNEFQDSSETARGLVVRMTGRNGKELFMAAIADPYNYDRKRMTGPIMLCLDETYADETDCACAADSLAEFYAESEREYQAKERERIEAEEAKREQAEAQHWAERDTITTA